MQTLLMVLTKYAVLHVYVCIYCWASLPIIFLLALECVCTCCVGIYKKSMGKLAVVVYVYPQMPHNCVYCGKRLDNHYYNRILSKNEIIQACDYYHIVESKLKSHYICQTCHRRPPRTSMICEVGRAGQGL
jgi:hypothetical protein